MGQLQQLVIWIIIAAGQGKGDINNAEQLAHVYQKFYQSQNHTATVQTIHVDSITPPANLSQQFEYTHSQHPQATHLFITAGPKGAQFLDTHRQDIKDLEKNIPIAAIIWSGHQPCPLLTNSVASKIYLPSYSITPEWANDPRVLALPVVPANFTSRPTTPCWLHTCSFWPKATHADEFLLIMPGDAMNEQGDTVLITHAWAEQLISSIATQWPDYHLTIISSPRTAKHKIPAHIDQSGDHITLRPEQCEIDNGHTIDNPNDHLSQKAHAVALGLHRSKKQTAKPNQVINFINGVPSTAYNEKLQHFIDRPNVIIAIPGDSASEIDKHCQHPILLHQRLRTYVIVSPSTSAALRQHISHLHHAGYFGIIDVKNGIKHADPSKNPKPLNPFSPILEDLKKSNTAAPSAIPTSLSTAI